MVSVLVRVAARGPGRLRSALNDHVREGTGIQRKCRNAGVGHNGFFVVSNRATKSDYTILIKMRVQEVDMSAVVTEARRWGQDLSLAG